MKNKWTDHDIEYAISNYQKMSASSIAEHLGRTRKSVYHFLNRLDINKMSDRWNDEELNYLKKNVRILSYLDISKHLNRTEAACYNKAYELGITKPDDHYYTNSIKDEEIIKYVLENSNTMTDYDISIAKNINISQVVTIRKNHGIFKHGGRSCGSLTMPEKYIDLFLKDTGVIYDCQSKFFGLIADFYIPSCKIIIEVNGDYWHGNPRIYKNNELDSIQQKGVDRDIRKYDVYNKAGFLTIIIWEQDILKSSSFLIIKEKLSNLIKSISLNNVDTNLFGTTIDSSQWCTNTAPLESDL
ncbi:hypothetical protein [uncultured Flavobacterium sp.]|uniref:hypothetical protein n=1 Tax=uncultured Flavobacterium sp. TaxID=165435 RepID=UPI002597FD9B|nr:hypothetical protein [uncultured Flavobacterium sp.]